MGRVKSDFDRLKVGPTARRAHFSKQPGPRSPVRPFLLTSKWSGSFTSGSSQTILFIVNWTPREAMVIPTFVPLQGYASGFTAPCGQAGERRWVNRRAGLQLSSSQAVVWPNSRDL